MKITIGTFSEEQLIERDFLDGYELRVDGHLMISMYDGEWEDNNLSRNFSDVHKIEDVIKLAFEAGKNGEELLFDYVGITD
ncbi:hypothetical protein [Brevibacillus laterosporus]|uniref:hypothetical protein n=1 Tax=Brevibacillus laterosporus TaxID=1465 RepID=UPI0018F8A548|nr:hypothetical protein [Brevibacillus laterosporus]MBG9773027.1 hypothetical protein [Brevibacillus laterosporus]